jgi:hypothetical protein
MRQYAICKIKEGRLGSGPDYVVILQRDLFSDMKTRVVAPLMHLGQVIPAERLHPQIQIDRVEYVIMIDRLAAIDSKLLVATSHSAISMRDEITRALDMLFTG